MTLKVVHIRLTALSPGLPKWAGTRKVKPIWILLKQETLSGNGVSWAICKSAPCSKQITTPAPHHSVFTGRMPFLPPNQQCQSTEGTDVKGGIQPEESVQMSRHSLRVGRHKALSVHSSNELVELWDGHIEINHKYQNKWYWCSFASRFSCTVF